MKNFRMKSLIVLVSLCALGCNSPRTSDVPAPKSLPGSDLLQAEQQSDFAGETFSMDEPIYQRITKNTEVRKFEMLISSPEGPIELHVELMPGVSPHNKVPTINKLIRPYDPSDPAWGAEPRGAIVRSITIKFKGQETRVEIGRFVLFDTVSRLAFTFRGCHFITRLPKISCKVSSDGRTISVSICGGDGEGVYQSGFILRDRKLKHIYNTEQFRDNPDDDIADRVAEAGLLDQGTKIIKIFKD